MAHLFLTSAPLVVLAALSGGCGRSDGSDSGTRTGMADSAKDAAAKPAELTVSNVMIGRRVGAGNHITEPTFQFAPQDTVYVSVGTSGSTGADHLTAAWRSQTGEVVQQSSEPIPAAGQNAAFQLSQPKGFKPGTYKVIVFLGDDSVETKVFVVKK
ncbi:MAG: hypothetical protein ACREOQ_05725 [Gemmatimonadales bacterium]